jgi:hypothetical protein
VLLPSTAIELIIDLHRPYMNATTAEKETALLHIKFEHSHLQVR